MFSIGLAEIVLIVNDVRESAKFYRDVVGFIYAFRSPSCARTNYSVEVDARWSGATGVSYGIVFGVEGAFTRYYLFDISPDFQEFALIRRHPAGFSFIQTFTPSSVIQTSGVNHLKVIRNGGQITVEVNGTPLGTWDDFTIGGSTGAGVYSIPYTNSPVSDARFDNFSMKTLAGAATASGGQSALQDRRGAFPSTHRDELLNVFGR